jgi:hypothetical protein
MFQLEGVLPISHEPQDHHVTVRFALSSIVAGHAYPPAEMSAEIGRITIAAARVDREMALNLVAIRHSARFEELLTWSSSDLYRAMKKRLEELFESNLLESALQDLDAARTALNYRNSVAHTIWSLRGAAAAISISDLAAAESEEAMDQLLRRDVDSPAWETLHPKTHGAGPQSLKELRPIRADLERAQEGLQSLRFKLASALFSGMPPGAKQVLEP